MLRHKRWVFLKGVWLREGKVRDYNTQFFHDDTELSGQEVCGDFTESATLFLQVLFNTDRAVMKVSDKLYGSGPILTGKVKRNMFVQFPTSARQLTR